MSSAHASTASTRDGGAGLPLDKLVRRKACDAAFPLHEEDELKSLEARWIRMWARPAQLPSERARPRRPNFSSLRVDGVGAAPSRHPSNSGVTTREPQHEKQITPQKTQVRSYFGEKIAFY